MTPAETREAGAEIARTVGERMRLAREAAGMSQVEAARRLGYANSSKLSKIEKGRSSEVPLWAIKRAGWLYHVPLDYLLGACDNPAGLAGIPAPILDSVCAGLIRDTERRRADAEALIAMARCWMATWQEVAGLGATADHLDDAREGVESQEAWLDVRGGAKLARHSRRTTELLQQARQLAMAPLA